MRRDLWKRLAAIAGEETERLLTRIPAPLRAEAAKLPVVCEIRPGRDLLAAGVAADTMGLFEGRAYGDPDDGEPMLAPQIRLFIENIWAESGGDEDMFREEVRTTLLHEWGHYLGLDESQLVERDLE